MLMKCVCVVNVYLSNTVETKKTYRFFFASKNIISAQRKHKNQNLSHFPHTVD